MTDYHTTAVAFGDLKNVALYFDYVIPVFFAVEFIGEESEWKFLCERQHDLLPPDLMNCRGFPRRLTAVNQATLNVLRKFGVNRFGLQPKIVGLSDDQYAAIEDTAISEYFSFIDEYDLKDYPIASASGPGSAWMEDEGNSLPTPVVTLADLKVVDASRVPWQQLVEFRRDREARDRLRRLRLFAHENYSGRSRSYMEDDILMRVSEYDETVQQWGLETVNGALSVVLNSKLAASVIAGTFLSTLFGQPATALLAGAAGAIVEVGHIAVEVSRQRFALRKLIRDSPVSFVSYSRRKLNRVKTR
jgi:hypothetical protein